MIAPDPILEELRSIREAIARSSDDDLKRIAESAKARQPDSGHQVVQLPPKRVPSAKKAS
jgi:hypothetical protein